MRLAGTTVAILALAIFHHTALALTTLTSEQTTLIDTDILGHPELDFGYDLPSRTSRNRKFRRGAVIRKCRLQPEDASWPGAEKWQLLEDVVTPGSFSKPPPAAAVCYAGDLHNEAECARVVGSWYSSDFHEEHPSSIMSPLFTGLSCLPTANATSGTCTQGTYPVYVVSARTVRDVQASVNFARNQNLRLVVKNTGHDFAGKSSGRGALSVRTHLLNEMAFIEEYDEGGEGGYSGPAFKVGAGVQGRDVYAFAKGFGYVVVGGEGATVGYAGGYIQGGGHSPLSSILGMGADSVLSLDVVMANGRFITASKDNHPDLYWALCGGGGSTFAIVTSITVKAHRDLPVTISQFTFTASARDMQAISTGDLTRSDFWEVVKAYFRLFPAHGDLGIYSYWNIVVQPDLGIHFIMAPFFAPKFTPEEVNSLFSPLISKATSFGIHLEPTTRPFDNFHDAWKAGFPQERVGGWNAYPGSRLFPRENFVNETLFEKTFQVIKNEGNIGTFPIIGFNIAPTLRAGAWPDNSVNPAWRDSVMHAITGISWDENIRDLKMIQEWQREFTLVRLQKWRDVCPNSGCYLGETDINEPNHQLAFWGSNYERLYRIKQRYDPLGVFFAETSVGAEDWTTGFWRIGALCPV
ncbi:FAD-binding domain-containing protein [Choiromyces venosus 120613-1]|uniref:FAD-binding domain-containing protein n=1 Tax=Choiromyces venosus 120613-1 TaxID=1336337 RepID=A0A3N4JJE8_9PEZI|nr:FAD-binding domain-containing protein [Choiromyces venosus 120613-1]